MKRICALLLIIAMIFSMAGCGVISRAARKAVGDTLEKIAEVEKATPTVPPTAKPTSTPKPSPTPEVTSEPEESDIPDEAATEASGTVLGVTPEFKATMDAYEEFFDEYIAFMKKYKESDNSTAMLADYLKFLGEYAEMIDAMDDIDDTELSTADSLYYAEVQLRISQKLMEAASDT